MVLLPCNETNERDPKAGTSPLALVPAGLAILLLLLDISSFFFFFFSSFFITVVEYVVNNIKQHKHQVSKRNRSMDIRTMWQREIGSLSWAAGKLVVVVPLNPTLEYLSIYNSLKIS